MKHTPKWRSRIRQWIKLRMEYVRWYFCHPAFPIASDGKTRLHIGCGEIGADDFINIDARPLLHVHIVKQNIADLSEFQDESVDLVYMSHVLEHVQRNEVGLVMSEMHRVLKNGGVLRISVPDFDLIIDMYSCAGRQIGLIAGPLMGEQNYPFNFHRAVFNREFMTKTFVKYGFSEVRTWDPNHCDHHNFTDWASKSIPFDGKEYPVSLNLEAVNVR